MRPQDLGANKEALAGSSCRGDRREVGVAGWGDSAVLVSPVAAGVACASFHGVNVPTTASVWLPRRCHRTVQLGGSAHPQWCQQAACARAVVGQRKGEVAREQAHRGETSQKDKRNIHPFVHSSS